MGEISAADKTQYLSALKITIGAGKSFVEDLPSDEATRVEALNRLPSHFARLDEARHSILADFTGFEKEFLEAAGEMQSGYILIVSSKSVEDLGPVTESAIREVAEAFSVLTIVRDEVEAGVSQPLNFRSDLMRHIEPDQSPQQALKTFQDRAIDTLDDMVSEAHEILIDAVDKFKDKFDKFADNLAELANSFSGAGGGVIKAGLEKILSGLQSLAKILDSDRFADCLALVKDNLKDGLRAVLTAAYKCNDTKKQIRDLMLSPAMTAESIVTANNAMADLSKRYVGLLKQTKRMLPAIGVAGTLLVMTGVNAHFAALGVPIAYAVVFIATILIGMDFAKTKMQNLIEGI